MCVFVSSNLPSLPRLSCLPARRRYMAGLAALVTHNITGVLTVPALMICAAAAEALAEQGLSALLLIF